MPCVTCSSTAQMTRACTCSSSALGSHLVDLVGVFGGRGTELGDFLVDLRVHGSVPAVRLRRKP